MRGRKKIIRSLLGLLPVVVMVSCQEVYDPRVSADEEILVVDGLLTDSGLCRVALSQAVPYDDPWKGSVPVTGASVTVLENDSVIYDLQETALGIYDLPSLTTHPGYDYILLIHTGDEEYRSTPQRMMPPYDPDTIFGELTVKEFSFTGTNGDKRYHSFKGGDIHLGFRDLPDSAKAFRFIYSFYVQYIAMDTRPLIPVSYYIWHKEGFPYVLNFTGSGFPVASGEMLHDLCFFPFDKDYYSFVQQWPNPPYEGGMDAFVVMFDQYRLNEDAEKYYADMKKLLDAEGKMFDPLASQLPGNITCITDPHKKVVGFFEVSSYTSYAYQVINHGTDEPLTFKKTPSLKGVPKDGSMKDKYPPFWVFRGDKR